MTWTVDWSKGAGKDLEKLDPTVADRVTKAVNRLAEEGVGDVKKLKGMGGMLRLRVGDWRVFFVFDVQRELIQVLGVSHRSDAYE